MKKLGKNTNMIKETIEAYASCTCSCSCPCYCEGITAQGSESVNSSYTFRVRKFSYIASIMNGYF